MSKLGGTVFELDYITVDIDETYLCLCRSWQISDETCRKTDGKETEGAFDENLFVLLYNLPISEMPFRYTGSGLCIPSL